MLDARIVYLGMPLVSAVTELIVAELLYLQYKDRNKPMNMYINSTGTTRADGEAVRPPPCWGRCFDVPVFVSSTATP